MRIVAIIPAAGKGLRFGMPKVDASFNGISFAENITTLLELTGVTEHIVVRDVETPDMLASVRWGIQQFLGNAEMPDGWLVWPVDHPGIDVETIKILLEEFSTHRNSVVIPRYKNKGGHPIMLPGALILSDKPNPLGLKGVIISSAFPVYYVNVNDPGILHNINTPQDINYV